MTAAAAFCSRIHKIIPAISIGGGELTDDDDDHDDDHRETNGAHLRAENNASRSSTTADLTRPTRSSSPRSPLKPSAPPVFSPSPSNDREGTALNDSDNLPVPSGERWRWDRVKWPGVLRKAFFVSRLLAV